jgi:hypothetical protein
MIDTFSLFQTLMTVCHQAEAAVTSARDLFTPSSVNPAVGLVENYLFPIPARFQQPLRAIHVVLGPAYRRQLALQTLEQRHRYGAVQPHAIRTKCKSTLKALDCYCFAHQPIMFSIQEFRVVTEFSICPKYVLVEPPFGLDQRARPKLFCF